MTLTFNSPQEIADFLAANAQDEVKMAEYAAYLKHRNSVQNDAGLASSVNCEVQIAPSENVPETNDADIINDSVELKTVQSKLSPELVDQSNQPTLAEASKSVLKKNSGLQTKMDENPKAPLIFKREYYSLQDVAESFGIGVSSMHKLRKDGHIVGFLLGGKWMFTREQIENFETRLTSGQITK